MTVSDQLIEKLNRPIDPIDQHKYQREKAEKPQKLRQ